MTSLSARPNNGYIPKGHSPKKLPGWVWLAVVIVLLFMGGNAIYMATDATAEEAAEESGPSSSSSSAELAEKEALAKVERVKQKMAELAQALDDDTRSRLQGELNRLLEDLTSDGMRTAIRESPGAIMQKLAEAMKEAIIAQQVGADVARDAGNMVLERQYVTNAQDLAVALNSMRGTLDSSVHTLSASATDVTIDEALAVAADLSTRYWDLSSEPTFGRD